MSNSREFKLSAESLSQLESLGISSPTYYTRGTQYFDLKGVSSGDFDAKILNPICDTILKEVAFHNSSQLPIVFRFYSTPDSYKNVNFLLELIKKNHIMNEVHYMTTFVSDKSGEILKSFDKKAERARKVITGLANHYKRSVLNILIGSGLPQVLADITVNYSDLSSFPFDLNQLGPLFEVPQRDGLYAKFQSPEKAEKFVEDLRNLGFVGRQDDNHKNNKQDDFRRPTRDLSCIQFFSQRPLLDILNPAKSESQDQIPRKKS